jgi:hypothetical protein
VKQLMGLVNLNKNEAIRCFFNTQAMTTSLKEQEKLETWVIDWNGFNKLE